MMKKLTNGISSIFNKNNQFMKLCVRVNTENYIVYSIRGNHIRIKMLTL